MQRRPVTGVSTADQRRGAPLLLLHSAYGVRPAVHDAAVRLSSLGYQVEVPDLYGGRTASSIDEALALRDALLDRARVLSDLRARAAALRARAGGAPLTVVGFSYGAARAQDLALLDPGVGAAVLFHGTSSVPPGARTSARILGHFGERDPFEPADELADNVLRLTGAGALVTTHTYPGAGHVFTDPGLVEHDPGATALAWERTLAWLAGSRA